MASFPISRIILILAIILSLVAGGKSYMNRAVLLETRAKLAQTEATLTKTAAELVQSQEAEKAAKEEIQMLTDAKAAIEAQLKNTTEELAAVKKSNEEALAQIKEKDEKITELETKIAEAGDKPKTETTEGGETAEAPVGDELKIKLADAEAKVAAQATEIQNLRSDAESARGQVAALEQRERDRIAGQSRQGLEGRVIAVNPTWNFVVLNIGDRQGVAAGSSLIVKRGGELVGKLKVSSVEPTTSIADILDLSGKEVTTIQPGDTVIFTASGS